MDETKRAAVVLVPFDDYERGQFVTDQGELDNIEKAGKQHFLTFVSIPAPERKE